MGPPPTCPTAANSEVCSLSADAARALRRAVTHRPLLMQNSWASPESAAPNKAANGPQVELVVWTKEESESHIWSCIHSANVCMRSLLRASSQTAFWGPELPAALSRAGVQGPRTPELLHHPICVSSVCRARPPLEGREHTQHAIWGGTGKTEPFCNSVSVWAASLLPWWSQLASLFSLCL